jgi:hypothetical protein
MRIVVNCNYIQYRMEFRIWSLRTANGVYSLKVSNFLSVSEIMPSNGRKADALILLVFDIL